MRKRLQMQLMPAKVQTEANIRSTHEKEARHRFG